MPDAFHRECQQTFVVPFVQHVGFAGGSGHHDALGTSVELMIDQPRKGGQIERPAWVERRRDGAQAAGNVHEKIPALVQTPHHKAIAQRDSVSNRAGWSVDAGPLPDLPRSAPIDRNWKPRSTPLFFLP